MHIHNEKILGFLARQIGHVAALSNSMGTLTYELKHMGALTYELAPAQSGNGGTIIIAIRSEVDIKSYVKNLNDYFREGIDYPVTMIYSEHGCKYYLRLSYRGYQVDDENDGSYIGFNQNITNAVMTHVPPSL